MAATQAEANAMTSTNTLLTPNLNKIILGTEVASTSGTAIDYTGFPSGVRRITVMFNGVSTNGPSIVRVQLGDAGGIETSGYTGTIQSAGGNAAYNGSAGFDLVTAAIAAEGFTGKLVLDLEDSSDFTWIGTSLTSTQTTPRVHYGSGSKSLSAELTQIRITTINGTDTFDAGAVNVSYER